MTIDVSCQDSEDRRFLGRAEVAGFDAKAIAFLFDRVFENIRSALKQGRTYDQLKSMPLFSAPSYRLKLWRYTDIIRDEEGNMVSLKQYLPIPDTPQLTPAEAFAERARATSARAWSRPGSRSIV